MMMAQVELDEGEVRSTLRKDKLKEYWDWLASYLIKDRLVKKLVSGGNLVMGMMVCWLGVWPTKKLGMIIHGTGE